MDKKIKIAIVVYTLKSGGLERVVSNQTMMFSRMGFEVDLFVLENEIEYPFEGKLHVYNLKKSDVIFNKLQKYLSLAKDIKKGNFDYVLDHRYRLNKYFENFWLNFIYKNQRLLYFVHSSDIGNYVNLKLANSSKIEFVSVSKGIENLLRDFYPKINIRTIYNAVEVVENEKYFNEFNQQFVLAVGRMDESNVKQFDVLIDSYAKSDLPQKNIKLLILGTGIKETDFKRQVSHLKLTDKVIFKGFETELFSYYKKAHFLILCSKYEGLPTVLIESLMCGTPVISYDCDFGPSEIILHKKNGLLVENQNSEKLTSAINLFVNDSDLYSICKENAKQSVQKFSVENIAQIWDDFFNDKR